MSQPEVVEKPSETVEVQSEHVSEPSETNEGATSVSEQADPEASTNQEVAEQQQQPETEQSQPEEQTQTEEKASQQDKSESNNEQDESQSNLTLPIARIKRIFKLDPDYAGASASAVYTAGLATELFVQYFVEQASLLAKMDKRKKIQYKDFANAVSAHDSLNFLSDTVPKTHPIGELVQQKKVHVKQPTSKVSEPSTNGTSDDPVASASSPTGARPKNILPKGQQTLNFPIANSNSVQKPEGTQKNSILDLVTRDDETDADKDVIMKD
ncbi:MAG: NFYB/HAP3 family transcription factor subunit [Asgard group archaeon]|nr:NFYB/HAP3 family transcription factor subunit [Asgard group archaeon]